MLIPLFLLGVSTCLITLGLLIWRARPFSAINRLFCIQTVFFAFWILGVAGVYSGSAPAAWGRLAFASATMIPPTFLAFSRLFPVPVAWPPNAFLYSALGAGGLLAVIGLATPFVISDVKIVAGELVRTPGPLFWIFAVFFLSVQLLAIGVLVSKWWHVRGMARAQLQHLSAAIVITSTAAILVNLVYPAVTGRSVHSWVGPFFGAVFVAIVGHSIIRYRLLDLKVIVNRSLSRVIGAAVMSVVFIAAWRLVGDDAGSGHEVWVVVVAVLLTFSAPAQRLFSALIDPYLYRGQIDYPAAVREATHRLSSLMPPEQLRLALHNILDSAYKPEWIAICLDPDGRAESSDLDAIARAGMQLVAKTHEGPIVVIDPAGLDVNRRTELRALLEASAEVVLGLRRRDRPLGAVILGARRSGDAYFTGDLQFLESIAELASVSLENALLYREQMQILEYSNRLLASLSSAVVAIDASGRLTSFNAAACELLGIDDGERGATIDILPSDIAWLLALSAKNAWRPRDLEISIEVRNRLLPFPAIVSTADLKNEHGEPHGALVVITDLTTVKELEQNRRRLEHLTLMARFYAGIAHEIRTPLTSISNFISLLPDRFDDPEYRDVAARILPEEVSRIVQLSERLRLMAPSEGGTLAPIRISAFLADMVALHNAGGSDNRVRLFLDCDDGLPEILGDRAQLMQLFHNIIRNAQDAMPQGGHIAIKARSGDGPAGAIVVVRVVDEGVGIDPSLSQKVFEPFFTTKPSGTGLGLSICREIADFHRAKLTISPRRDRAGTVVEIAIPIRIGDQPGALVPPSVTELARS